MVRFGLRGDVMKKEDEPASLRHRQNTIVPKDRLYEGISKYLSDWQQRIGSFLVLWLRTRRSRHSVIPPRSQGAAAKLTILRRGC